MGIPGRVVREIDADGVGSPTNGATLYVNRWKCYVRELKPIPSLARA